MSRFLKVGNKYVNLAQVLYIYEKWTKDECEQLFYGVDRELIATSDYRIDLDSETAELVAAPQGMNAQLVTCLSSGSRPTSDDMEAINVPVVAWRIEDMGCSPIFFEKPASNQTVLLPLPDGRFALPYDREFPDISSAIAYLLKEAQDDWDRRHKPASESSQQNSPT